uniref:E3 ubiquitin-protein ligase n=1 Tax=Physcomitrium patens TaxID=3218 RepID=A0A2K1KCP5_PHYPA|nr:E3 ubiquitin-protein ligase PRT6-like isoform X4 [Physcomitrium patens]PNR51519.1 hypothetical protein PHYPA_010706 [Physcomitrium patens]|eukprot:XP_024380592.1 E3 ubiquitin-protein ligase PRT6-like isoform X4 [Physcomitrella patens]
MSCTMCSELFTPGAVPEILRNHENRMCLPTLSFSQYLDYLQARGQANCTTVWTKGTVAYRCRTCQVNDSSAICVSCFLKGDHKDHDYVMYHSESGGCCDCGDPEAWLPEGFCSAHKSVDRYEPNVPPDLVEVTQKSLSNVLFYLAVIVLCISEERGGSPIPFQRKIEVASVFLDWLKKLCGVDALRKIVCLEVVQMTVKDRETLELTSPLQILLKTLANMPEEILEGETTLFLQLLYNQDFKQYYSMEIMKHYQTMIESVIDKIVDNGDPLIRHFKALDSSLDRVMVQLFNAPNLELIKSKNLLKLFVMVLDNILKRCVKSGCNVVNVRDPRIENKLYLRPQGDLRLVIAHQSVAQYLLEERLDVFTSMLDVLILLQWMNPYYPTRYIEFEEHNEWTLAIQLEMNTMAIIFQLVSRCHLIIRPELEDPTETSKKTLLSAAKCTLDRLYNYLKQESTLRFLNGKCPNTSVSLHIPLHRTLSAIMAKLVLLPWPDVKDGFLSCLELNYSEQEILALMEHPLRITVWMAQIRANRWVDMSEDFNRLELIYRGSFWHDQSMDMDILLLQFCAVARENMERAVFTRMAERFELKDLVSSPILVHGNLVGDKVSLLQDFMRLILMIVRERRNTGMKEEDCLRYDVIQWLCVRDQTYSQLCRALSAVPVDHFKLTEMLDKVAYFHAPKVQERGYYQLKAEYWQEFDPLFVHFYSNELEDAQERAINVGKLPHYWRIRSYSDFKPPYNRLINLLHTEECHQLLWNVLNFVSALVMKDSTATACESLGVTALQMMGLALLDRRENPERFPAIAKAGTSNPLSCSDILHSIHRSFQFDEHTRTMDWGISQPTSPSIFDFLLKLQVVENAPRLVDSVNYIMQLLPASSFNFISGASKYRDFNLSSKSHARVYTTEENERIQKKERQEAIMAQFKAKQKAFWEEFEVSDDEGETGSATFATNNLEARSSVQDLTVVPSVGAGSEKKLVEPIEVHECAFCRSECGSNDKSTGWIALVQRYNIPKLVIGKRQGVYSKEHANNIVKLSNVTPSGGSPSDASAKQLVVCMEENMIDHIPTEHVRCCGHQMHHECFQSYHASLFKRDYGEAIYEGKSIIELCKSEFLCPICRRLANVLLPVVYQGSLSKMMQASLDDDLDNRPDHWMEFWNTCKTLPEALDQFAFQSLNVRSNFSKVEEASDLPKCPVYWEVFASNIAHCEVETREELVDVASSSTALNPASDQRTWGGDSGHWIAIRELGKLAMVYNTLHRQKEVVSKGEKLKQMLLQISRFLPNREPLIHNEDFRSLFTSVYDVLNRLQRITEEIFQSEEPDCEILNERLGPAIETATSLYKPISSVYSSQISNRNLDGHYGRPPLWPPSEPPMLEMHQARGMSEGFAPGDDVDIKVKETFSSRQANSHYPSESENSILTQIDMEWSSAFQKGNVFDTDPFWLLIGLLSAFPVWPNVEDILLLVKFSYTVALTQVLRACSKLQNNDDRNVLTPESGWDDVVQYTCLPFLRRAALLMQSITGEGCKKDYNGPGRKVMDALYLQQELGLANTHKIFNTVGGVAEPSLIQQLLEHNLLSKEHSLMEVPKVVHLAPLPIVYQELLLRSISEKCIGCDTVPMEPALCLVCNVFFCCGTECCVKHDLAECSYHAEIEGSGIGIYLLMRSTQLVLIRGGRVCMAPSLYLDQHGEEDTFLRRNQLLHLSKLRLNEVRRLWLTAGFDHDTHILHISQISVGTL